MGSCIRIVTLGIVLSLVIGGRASAAPQILGLLATMAPTPLTCDDGLCSAQFSAFCLQLLVDIARKFESVGMLLPKDNSCDITVAVIVSGGKPATLRQRWDAGTHRAVGEMSGAVVLKNADQCVRTAHDDYILIAVRIKIGKLKLEDLPPGKWRTLTDTEIKSLLAG